MIQKYTKPNAITLKVILFLSGLCTSHFSKAQTFIGLQQSNYGGIHQANLNPANITNSRHKFYTNAFTFGFGFNNDYLTLDLPFSVLKLATGQVPAMYHQDGDPNKPVLLKKDEWLKETLNGKGKNLNIYLQTRVPGFMFALPKGFAVGLQYKNTLSFQVNDFAQPLAQLAKNGIDSIKGTTLYSGPNTYQVGQNFKDNAFTINLNSWGEWAGTVAKTLIKEDNMVLKAGFTGKYLIGYASGYIKNNGVEFKIEGDDSITFGKTDLEYGYTNIDLLKSVDAVNLDYLVKKPSGAGFGYDIGATLELKPEGTKRITNKYTNYLFRVGLSLLDGGSIRYKNNIETLHITNKPNTGFKASQSFAEAWASGSENGLDYTDSSIRTKFNIDTTQKTLKTKMPTTLNLQFDYNIFKGFYVGANLSQDMRGKKNIGIRKASYIVVIPRFEHKFVEVSLPIGMMNDYKTARVGFYLRVGPVFIGSDNLIGQLKKSSFKGADIYFGISSGLLKKKKSDSTQ